MQFHQLKSLGKSAIKGNIFISFLVIITVSIINGIPSLVNSMGGENTAFTMVGGLLGLAVFIGTMPMQVGIKLYFINLTATNTATYTDLFKPYKNGSMEELIKAKLLTMLYVILGLILFIIPGIYLALKYAMIDYIFAENPKATYKEAMQESADITKGNKLRYLLFGLSFILWVFACIVVFPIIYVAPYIEASMLQFYYSIKKEAPQQEPIEYDIYKAQ